MALIKSKEYREEQRLRLKSKVDELVDSAILNPDHGAGIHSIDDLDHVITSGSYSRICIREKQLLYTIEDLTEQVSRLQRRLNDYLRGN